MCEMNKNDIHSLIQINRIYVCASSTNAQSYNIVCGQQTNYDEQRANNKPRKTDERKR